MATINEIIIIMKIGAHCYEISCLECEKINFCWYDTLNIAIEYIKREGVI